jgi:hypothetical protein
MCARDTTLSYSSPVCAWRHDTVCLVKTHSQSSPVCVWRRDTVSVQSEYSVSPVLYMCVRATRHSLSLVKTHSQSSPVCVWRRDTVSVQSKHSLSPVLYVCELTFSFPSSKESRVKEQALSRLVTIYKPHEYITTYLFIYRLYIHIYICVCVCILQNIRLTWKSALCQKARPRLSKVIGTNTSARISPIVAVNAEEAANSFLLRVHFSVRFSYIVPSLTVVLRSHRQIRKSWWKG